MELDFYKTLQKYGWAISQNLHPSQTKKLNEALKTYNQQEDVYIADPFVKLVFDMIVADWLYQKGRNTE